MKENITVVGGATGRLVLVTGGGCRVAHLYNKGPESVYYTLRKQDVPNSSCPELSPGDTLVIDTTGQEVCMYADRTTVVSCVTSDNNSQIFP